MSNLRHQEIFTFHTPLASESLLEMLRGDSENQLTVFKEMINLSEISLLKGYEYLSRETPMDGYSSIGYTLKLSCTSAVQL